MSKTRGADSVFECELIEGKDHSLFFVTHIA